MSGPNSKIGKTDAKNAVSTGALNVGKEVVALVDKVASALNVDPSEAAAKIVQTIDKKFNSEYTKRAAKTAEKGVDAPAADVHASKKPGSSN